MTVTLTQGRFSFEIKRSECGHVYRSRATWESKAGAISAETWAAENTLCAICARKVVRTTTLDEPYSHMHHWRPEVTLKAGHYSTFDPKDVTYICPRCRLYVFGDWYGGGYVCDNCALDPERAYANERLKADWNEYKGWSQVRESEETFFVKKARK